MRLETNTVNSIRELVDYIQQTEYEDFQENPSENHIYFHSLVVEIGLEKAYEQLNEHLKS
jgi:hypothetical protein